MSAEKENKHSMKEALSAFIKQNKLQQGMDRVAVRDTWKQVMGSGVSTYTTGVELREETLYVALSSAVLREELSLGRSKIIALLNEELGRELIKKLVLR